MKKYLHMFTQFLSLDTLDVEVLKTQISWARTTLIKEDRIVWFLRIYRYMILRCSNEESVKLYCEKQLRKYTSINSLQFYFEDEQSEALKTFEQVFKPQLQHFMDLDASEVHSFVFKDQNITVLFSTLKELESSWRAKLDREVPEYGVPYITVGSYTWFNLGVRGCRTEGRAMGHCGNGSGSRNQVVWSLRSRSTLNVEKWVPHVTLILQQCEDDSFNTPGYTGEIKGYGNNKPGEKYHEALVAFLTSDRVLGMQGGGYKEENNFTLSDLSQDKREKLKLLKPELFSIVEHLIDSQGEVTDGARKALLCKTDKLTLVKRDDVLVGGSLTESYFVQLKDVAINAFAVQMDMPKLQLFSTLLELGRYGGCPKQNVDALRGDVEEHLNAIFKSVLPCGHFVFDKHGSLGLCIEAEEFLSRVGSILLQYQDEFDVVKTVSVRAKLMQNVLSSISDALIIAFCDYDAMHDIDTIAEKHKALLSIADSHQYGVQCGSDSELFLGKLLQKLTSDTFADQGDDLSPQLKGQIVSCIYEGSLVEFFRRVGMDKAVAFSQLALKKDSYTNSPDEVVTALRSTLVNVVTDAVSFLSSPVYLDINYEYNTVQLYVLPEDVVSEVSSRNYSPGAGDDIVVTSALLDKLGDAVIEEGQYKDIEQFAEANCDKLNFVDLLQCMGGKVTDLVLSKADEGIETFISYEKDSKPCSPYVELFSGDVEDLADAFDMTELKSYISALQNGFIEVHGASRSVSDVLHLAEAVLDESDKLRQKVIAVLGDDLDSDEIDPDDTEKLVAQLLEENESEVSSAINSGIINGEESGAYNELSVAYIETVKELCEELGATFEWGDENNVTINMALDAYIEKIVAYYLTQYSDLSEFSESNFDELEGEAFDPNYIDIKADLTVPYYGFSGFDDESCQSAIHDGLHDLLGHVELLKAA